MLCLSSLFVRAEELITVWLWLHCPSCCHGPLSLYSSRCCFPIFPDNEPPMSITDWGLWREEREAWHYQYWSAAINTDDIFREEGISQQVILFLDFAKHHKKHLYRYKSVIYAFYKRQKKRRGSSLSAELSIFLPTSFVFLYYLNYLQGISSIIKIRENGSIKETIYFPWDY